MSRMLTIYHSILILMKSFAAPLCLRLNNCYNPSSGQNCYPGGVICSFGYAACGKNCYDPSSGQNCYPGGVICRFGYAACGNSCYDPSGQNCFKGSLVCPFGYKACGNSCYNPSSGQRCLNNNINKK
ncbi:hypothetical protein ACTFIZ_004279 [Dictyostelium cf. discoideum]